MRKRRFVQASETSWFPAWRTILRKSCGDPWKGIRSSMVEARAGRGDGSRQAKRQ